MPRKGENIYKRHDGRWEARYIKGHEPSGKIKYGSCYGRSYTEAKEKAAKCRAEIINGAVTAQKRGTRTFAELCDEWLRASAEHLKPASYVKYSTTVEKYIKPCLGALPPQSISAEVTERFSTALLNENGLAPKTVKDVLSVLSSALKYAARQVQGVTPVPESAYPREERKPMRVLTPREQQVITDYLLAEMNECKFGILLALLTGLRIGELCALRWEAVSVEDGTLTVAQSMQRLKRTEPGGARTQVLISAPKSDASARVIPLTPLAREMCARMRADDARAFVLTGTQNYIEPRTLQYRFKKYMAGCGLADVHFHILRHTFATRCVEVGFELKSLSEVLGHSSTRVTLDRYVHPSIQLKRDNMAKLSELGM